MHKPFTIFLLLVFIACKQKSKPAAAITKTDTIIPLTDTTILPNALHDPLQDSLRWKHERDSFYAIKTIATYSDDVHAMAFDKLIADIIDTTGVTTIPLEFSDTAIVKRNKEDDIIYKRQVLKNSHFTIEVIDPDYSWDHREIIINGHKLRKGVDLDTSVTGTDYASLIEINPGMCALKKFGDKEYLFLTGDIEKCNGMGCGVQFYLLYDPGIKKAMVLQQFRSAFIAGYDKKNKTPVFIDLTENYEQNGIYQCYFISGKVYRFNHAGKSKPVLNKAGKQIEFSAWAKDFDSLLHVIKGNFLAGN